jgi:hypothetical protein
MSSRAYYFAEGRHHLRAARHFSFCDLLAQTAFGKFRVEAQASASSA